MNLKKKNLLIYIPCHKDYEMAVKNIKKINNQIISLDVSNLELEIVLSVNNVDQLKGIPDLPYLRVSHLQTFVGGDSNIAKGFVTALEKRPDYFWIVSANEDLDNNVILNISRMLRLHPDVDLFIANAAGRTGKLSLDNVFFDQPSSLALGLISGVIYKFESTKNSFLQSTLFAWTGWGHLSVIQNFLGSGTPNELFEIPDSSLYAKPYTFSPDTLPGENERETVRKLYSHSFFGLPVLAYCFLQNDLKSLKRFQYEWIKLNWYKLNSFCNQIVSGDELNLQRVGWIKTLSRHSFNTFFLLRILYLLSSKLPSGRLVDNHLANKILSLYKKKI